MKPWALLGPATAALLLLLLLGPASSKRHHRPTERELLLRVPNGAVPSRFKPGFPPGPDYPGGGGSSSSSSSLRGRRRLAPGRDTDARRRVDDEASRRHLVSGGTPTGGRKYPFLVLVQYTNESSEGAAHFSPEPYCHGVMVAKDVLLKPAWCDPNEGVPLVVGDYDESSSTPSVQFIDLSSERSVVTSPDGILSLEKVGPVTLPGFFPVPVANDTSEPIPGRNVTLVGYGSNSSWDVWWEGDAVFPGVAMEVPLQGLVFDFCEEATMDAGINSAAVFCAANPAADFPFTFQAAGPCYGDFGAPVLDDNGVLVGMATEDTSKYFRCSPLNLIPCFILTLTPLALHDKECDNRVVPSKFIRVPYYLNWIVENVCQLTDDTESTTCPDLICPPEERVLGYPEAEVPDATAKIRTSGGFKPINVVQSPLAGSLINGSTKALVVVTAQSGNISSCSWALTLPKITEVAWLGEAIDRGTYDRKISLLYEEDFRQGLAVIITAQLERRLDGNATVTMSTVFNETLTLSGVVNEATLMLQHPFLFQYGVNDVSLLVRDVQQANHLDAQIFGQDKPIDGQGQGDGQGEDEGDAGVE